MSPARSRGAALLTVLLTGAVAGCGHAVSGAEKMAACIESSGHGWHRVVRPFRIDGLRRLDLTMSLAGGPQEEESGSLEPYDDVYSLNPRVHFELAVLGKAPVQEANLGRLLRAIQTNPSAFELLLVSNDAQRPSGGGIVEECSGKLYPNQGP